MTLDQLKIFVTVAELQHLTRAAAVLRLTPSAVSSAVHALESRYATPLFDRVGRGIELSEAGRIFLEEARATLSCARAAEAALIELGGLQRGSLVVAASQTLASYWLPPHLIRFKSMYPAIEVQMREGNTASVARDVKAGDADLGFIEGLIDDPALAQAAVADDRLVIIADPGHRLNRRCTVGAEDLAASDWIFREAGFGTRAMFESMLRDAGIDTAALRIVLTLPSNEAICSAVRAGPYMAAVSELVAAPHIEAGRLLTIDFELPTRRFTLLRHKERYRSKAARALQALLQGEPTARP